MDAPAHGHRRKIQLIPNTVQIQPFEVGRDRRARRGFPKAVFTEVREGNEATGVGSHQISKQALFLPLMEKIQRLFATFRSKWFG
jgi:hypothetical protein